MNILLLNCKYFQKYVIYDVVKELKPFMLNKWLLFIQRVIFHSLISQNGIKDGFQKCIYSKFGITISVEKKIIYIHI